MEQDGGPDESIEKAWRLESEAGRRPFDSLPLPPLPPPLLPREEQEPCSGPAGRQLPKLPPLSCFLLLRGRTPDCPCLPSLSVPLVILPSLSCPICLLFDVCRVTLLLLSLCRSETNRALSKQRCGRKQVEHAAKAEAILWRRSVSGLGRDERVRGEGDRESSGTGRGGAGSGEGEGARA